MRELLGDVVMWLAAAVAFVAVESARAALFVVVFGGWCLLVLLLTGRLPWMVRRYF